MKIRGFLAFWLLSGTDFVSVRPAFRGRVVFCKMARKCCNTVLCDLMRLFVASFSGLRTAPSQGGLLTDTSHVSKHSLDDAIRPIDCACWDWQRRNRHCRPRCACMEWYLCLLLAPFREFFLCRVRRERSCGLWHCTVGLLEVVALAASCVRAKAMFFVS